MTLWHASTELHEATATVAAKPVYLAAQLLGLGDEGTSLGLDTSG